MSTCRKQDFGLQLTGELQYLQKFIFNFQYIRSFIFSERYFACKASVKKTIHKKRCLEKRYSKNGIRKTVFEKRYSKNGI